MAREDKGNILLWYVPSGAFSIEVIATQPRPKEDRAFIARCSIPLVIQKTRQTTHKVSGERERLRQLKAAHTGVNAKAWDTSHASLDQELTKFQKFLKGKARRAAEEEVVQVRAGCLRGGGKFYLRASTSQPVSACVEM